MDNEMLVKTIRELCQSKGIAISQLETDLEFGAGLISRWTKSSPSIDKIVDIADYFNVSIDEIVGYNNVINDKFLEKLIKQTVSKDIIWNKYDHSNENQPKKYSDPCDYDDFSNQYDYIKYCETHNEKSYFVKINSAYISIYGCYEYQNIINPSEIKLFIQPDDKADLIVQSYDYKQLKVLWLKVLYTLGDNAPDEIKAEEFKNSFINDFKKPEPPRKKKNIIFVSNPQNNKNGQQQLRRTGYVNPALTQRQINKSISESVSDIAKRNNQTEEDSNNNNISKTEE